MKQAGSDAFHVKLSEGLSKLGLELDEGQISRIQRYHELLGSRAIEIGAIAKGDREVILERHVLDSLRAAAEVGDNDRIAYDFGSGAGLPGIPLAIARPGCGFILVESRHWRAAFLELVVSELDVNARVERARVETMGVKADLVTARAFAPLDRTWSLAQPMLKPGGRLVFFAGRGLENPQAAGERLAGDGGAARIVPDLLDHGGPLVIIRGSD